MKSIPTNEMLVTDEEIFSAFDLTIPELNSVRHALETENIPEAKKELVHYFETRANVQYYFDYRSLPLSPIETDEAPYNFQACLGIRGSLKEFCLFAGRKLMEHIYVRPGAEKTELDLGKNYENLPHFNFYEDQGRKHRTTLDIFVRGQFFEYLSVLYHETGDKAVLAQFEEILDIFFKNYPLVVVNTNPDTSHFSYNDERDVMSTGWLTLSYISLLYTRLPYEIPVDTAFEIIKRIWFLGIQFRRFDTDSYEKYNHHMWERGLVPFILGTLFPEIPGFTAMRELGAEVIREHIRDDFNLDGGYSEHSISYWSGAALSEMICRGVQLSYTNHVPLLDEDTMQRIQNSFDALALISPPGKCYPSLGDNGNTMIDPILQTGVSSINNPYCREILKIRKGNLPSAEISVPLDYCNDKTGFFSSKSSLLSDANYILMSAKVDCGDTGHNHMDPLSLFVSIHGQEFIGEPYARHLYHTAWVGSNLRGYLYNMESHNVVLAYGKPIQPDYLYSAKWGVIRPDTPVESFITSEDGCYVNAYHDAYTVCRHTRKILSSRQKGFLIHDELKGGDRIKQEHIQRWHLMPDVTCRQLNERTLLLEKNGAKALFLWSGNPRLHLWKKEELCPSITDDSANLPFIIDACFMIDSFTPNGDIGPVSQDLLILDVTDDVPDNNCLDKFCEISDRFCEELIKYADNGQLTLALQEFNRLYQTI